MESLLTALKATAEQERGKAMQSNQRVYAQMRRDQAVPAIRRKAVRGIPKLTQYRYGVCGWH